MRYGRFITDDFKLVFWTVTLIALETFLGENSKIIGKTMLLRAVKS